MALICEYLHIVFRLKRQWYMQAH